ncbi:JamP protein [Candidatus Vecturithrix granuli]|uniref:Phenolphthiocerol/phthiocerol polyketide synthase subunit E n=1 Tax=Vecturithrix granuli TaxID=1499967 RepID=A0A081BVS0_VECG1|nr:JamP protein [Candidatus Vecturithrix granuli]
MSTFYQYDQVNDTDIAIIAMSCRFPGADNIEAFWRNLRDGVESISFFSEEELVEAGIDPELVKKPNYVRAKGVLPDVELFDASFFGFNPREASQMDPQHRLFLEESWKIIETAGYHPDFYEGLIGLYAGIGMNTYLLNNLSTQRQQLEATSGIFPLLIGNDKDYMPTKVSYKLNLKGPSVNVQTACSTSLVATHLACQALLNGECDMALAGGVSLQIPHKSGYLYQEGMILSPDGHCRAFDANAKGIVYGNGVGLIMLKRVADAINDGDEIHAIIKGSAINNDGSLKVAYTAPGVDGQAAVIAEAQAVADVDPETISYIETHGTGTALGDPIEIAALTKAFREQTDKNGFCAIGSVKTNVGHLDTAAAVAGVIKTVLALKHRQIPPSLNFEAPNPQIDFANTPFYVNAKLADWPSEGSPRRAGVSSFGFGGTNAHIILEEAPPRLTSGDSRPAQLLVLSAKSESVLENATTNLAAHLQQHPELNLADVAYTLQVGRHVFNHRRAIVCQDRVEAIKLLRSPNSKQVVTQVREQAARPVVFMFPGQGAQYVNMGRELYETEEMFRNCVNECSELLEPLLGVDLRTILYPENDHIEEAEQQLQQTVITQSAIFTIEYALAQLFMEWGIQPQAVIGHSIGEFAAACLAGVFSLENALKLVAARGQLMQSCAPGAMLSVSLPETETLSFLNPDLSIAAINAPNQSVVSGPIETIEALQHQLAEKKISSVRLHTSHAFHSAMMDPIVPDFAAILKKIALNPPQMEWISTVTGNRLSHEEATDSSYWIKNLRQTVRFDAGVQQLFDNPAQILLEVGPGRTLSTLAARHPHKAKEQATLSSLRHPQAKETDMAFLLSTLGKLWLEGVTIDWSGFYNNEDRYRVALPPYPFERKKYWIDPQEQIHVSQKPLKETKKVSHPLLESHFSENAEEEVYVAYLQPQKHWELDEHRMLKKAILPGTAYLEMAVAAFKDYVGVAEVELRDVSFLLPLIVEEGDKKEVQVILKKQGEAFEFVIRSQTGEKEWQEHVRGKIVHITDTSSLQKHNIQTIQSQCQQQQLEFPDNPETTHIEFMDYGPRWQNVRQVNLGENQALVKLTLPTRFIADVQSYTLHPALLDAAVGFLSLHDVGPCLPLSYQSLRLSGSLSQTIYSYIRYADDKKSPKDVLRFHITIMDEEGTELVSIENYTLRKIESKTLASRLSQTLESSKKADIGGWFYLPSWKRSQVPMNTRAFQERQQWLVFLNECGLNSKIVEQLQQHHQEVFIVKAGSSFSKMTDHEYTLNMRQPEDYNLLFNDLQSMNVRLNKIVHLWNVTGNEREQPILERLDISQNRGLHSFLSLAKAIGNHNISDEIALLVVSNNMQEVTGDELLYPEKATLLGAVKIIPQEYQAVRCRSIDIVLPESGSRQEAKLVEQLLRDFTTPISEDIIVAYRGNYRWKQTFEPLRLEHARKEHTRLRDRGVYLITGGLGGIGLVLAEHLAQKARVKLVLTGRSAFPAKEEQEKWLSTHDEQDSISQKIRKIQAIEATGSEVAVFSADAANLEQMAEVVAQTEKQFGQIHGIIHCAGIPDYKGVIQRRSREDTEEILAPKVKGTLILEHLSQHTRLDFFIVCSTIGAILHKMKFGQVGYSAANEFLDAFTYYKTSRDGTFNVSINWNDWKEVGMSERAEQRWVASHDIPEGHAVRHGIMLPSEGAEVFDRILEQSPAPRIVVSTQDLPTLIVKDAEAAATFLETPQTQSKAAKSTDARPELSTTYTEPGNTIEQELVELWQQFLGIEPIGIYDDFFELGGDSLLGTQIMARSRETFNVDIPMGRLFEDPTIAGIAAYIAKNQRTLQGIESISGEEREEGEI